MIRLYGELHHIDYSKFLSRIQCPKENQAPAPPWLIKTLGELLTSRFSFILKPFGQFANDKIADFAEGYGIFFTKLEIRGIALIKTETAGGDMLTISASIVKVDLNKLTGALGKPVKKTKAAGVLREAAGIVRPFINKTMDAVPPSAIVELFNLFVRDKAIALAEEYGVSISDVFLEHKPD